MNRITKTLIHALAGLVLCCFAARAYAQDAKLQLDNLDKLSDKAAHVTDVTLDGSLLEFAVKIMEKADSDDPDVKQIQSIVKNLKGIYVKSFEFDAASQYSKADVEAVRSQLTSPRWTKIVQSIDKRSNEHDEIYLLKTGEHIGGVVILVAEPRELTVVNIVGEVPVEKIAALQHHFVPSEKEPDSNKHHKKEGSHEEE
ncbi:MAG TPA: DUF4252 domain-containing protein [Candidatus Angelobacter sp.]|nr:DUF4252 domain-containing protein [Candidatus Angelobacter sp.]